MSDVKSDVAVPVTELMKGTFFIGTKTIRACPMSRAQYLEYRGWNLPDGVDPKDPVYLVEYNQEPKSEPNHLDHEGYISMSPKHVFDEVYRANGSLRFSDCMEALNDGFRIKVPEWKGYWFKEAGIVKVMTAEGEILETPHFQQYLFREDWSIIFKKHKV